MADREQIRGALGHKKKPRYTPKGYELGKGSVRVKGKTAKNVGAGKGQLRLVNGKWRKRKFTYKQRQDFRDRRAKDDVFGGSHDGRPNTR